MGHELSRDASTHVFALHISGSGNMSDEGLTKWQLALLVGAGAVTVAGGVLVCYVVSTRRSSSDPGGGVEVGSSSARKGSTQTTSEDGPTPSSSSGTGSTAQVR